MFYIHIESSMHGLGLFTIKKMPKRQKLYVPIRTRRRITQNECRSLVEWNTQIKLPNTQLRSNHHQQSQQTGSLQHEGSHKGKAVPLQAWSGPEGSRNLRFPHFMTMVQEGSHNLQVKSRTHIFISKISTVPADTTTLHLDCDTIHNSTWNIG